MFSEITVKEPLDRIAEDWDFLNEKIIKKFQGFLPVGQNIYGIRQRKFAANGDVIDLRKGNISKHVELGPNGIYSWKHIPLNTHFIFSGTPHRVSHNFGYWHINDKDEMYLPLPSNDPDGLSYFLVIMGEPKGDECDRFAWYCDQCYTMLHEEVYETGRLGFDGFWKAEIEAVKSYNADIRHRTCSECGKVNPVGYCWNPSRDTPEQQEARKIW
ncbi:hypothetical protein [Paenibacillus thalictri]|uniref:Uncharacterized protein n=1 Tax=Paenibacillus thalictri TaxID=2527873 RepID=A0A4Q9DKT8_9BACL|nr:hypothetical protein [Paenibacillus thalictri]TBL73340.1 hypothetical protein EYB31_27060 [Paenibacillus thalictri]